MPIGLLPVQQILGSPGTGGENDALSAKLLLALSYPTATALSVNNPGAISLRMQTGNGSAVKDLRTKLLRQVEVVLNQGVLSIVTATSHALTTFRTSSTVRANPPEVRIGNCLPRRTLTTGLGAKEHTHRSRAESMAHTHIFGYLTHDDVGRRVGWVGDHPEHARCIVIVRSEF